VLTQSQTVSTRPTKTIPVVAVLGVLFAAVPVTPAVDDSRTYEAVAFEPETDADVLAHRSNAVTNLTSVASDDETARRQLDRAAGGRAVTADADRPLSRFENDTSYAVYESAYYRLNASSETDGTYTLRLQPVTADRVVDELEVAYADASPEVRRVVDEREATVTADIDDDDTAARIDIGFGFDVLSVVVQFPVGSTVSAAAPASELFGTLAAGVVATPSTLPIAGSLLVGVVWGRDGVGRRLAVACLGVVAASAVHAAAAGVTRQATFPAVFVFVVDSVASVMAVPVVAAGYIHAADSE